MKQNKPLSKKSLIRLYLILPSVILLVITTVIPILFMLYTSFFRVDPVVFNSNWPFQGFKNYVYLILKDNMFWSSLGRTIKFIFYSVLPQLLAGLFLATLFYREFKGKRVVQTILLIPILATPIVVAMVWKYFFDFDTGFLNIFLKQLNLEPQPWLSTKGLPFFQNIPFIGPWLVKYFSLTYAFRTVCFLNFWQWTPFCFLVFYSGMTSLSTEIYEAAVIDGASTWQSFKYITLPLLQKLIWATAFIRIIDSLKVYAQVWVIFGNAETTRLLNIHLYTLGFTTSSYGMTSALGVIVVILISFFVGSTIVFGRRKNGN